MKFIVSEELFVFLRRLFKVSDEAINFLVQLVQFYLTKITIVSIQNI